MSAPIAQGQQAEDTVAAALIVVLLSGLSYARSARHALPLLARLGIPPAASLQALSLLVPKIAPESLAPVLPAPAPGPPAAGAVAHPAVATRTAARSRTRSGEVARHVRYLIASAKRFRDAPEPETMRKERRYLAQHLAAVGTARQAAAQVDAQVARHGPLLGWYAVKDARTTRECRVLDGSNFHADRPPALGYPGTLHGGTCRCRAGAPHPSGVLSDEALRIDREGAVLPFASEPS